MRTNNARYCGEPTRFFYHNLLHSLTQKVYSSYVISVSHHTNLTEKKKIYKRHSSEHQILFKV